MVNKTEDLEIYLSENQIRKRVAELGRDISSHYGDDHVVVLSVLTGAFMFTADLVRHFDFKLNLQFIRASSYISGTTSCGNVALNLNDLSEKIKGQRVLVIEDIVDTGRTYRKLMHVLDTLAPQEIQFCSFLFKPSRLIEKVKIDYLGFEIQDKFVVGYGLDLDGKYRELPFLGIIPTKGLLQ